MSNYLPYFMSAIPHGLYPKRGFMTDIVSISSYALPGAAGSRQVNGPDEDALAMAVAAGRAADPVDV
jgi:hypothetical protein